MMTSMETSISDMRDKTRELEQRVATMENMLSDYGFHGGGRRSRPTEGTASDATCGAGSAAGSATMHAFGSTSGGRGESRRRGGRQTTPLTRLCDEVNALGMGGSGTTRDGEGRARRDHGVDEDVDRLIERCLGQK